MSKFIKLNGQLVNTDLVATIGGDEVVMKNGDVIRGDMSKFLEAIEHDGKVIPVHTTTYAVTPFIFDKDDVTKIGLEEYPIIGWRVYDGWETSSRAKPVFHESGGDAEHGYSPFNRFANDPRERFPLAIRFDGSDDIWQEGCKFTRQEFVALCKDFATAAIDASKDKLKANKEEK